MSPFEVLPLIEFPLASCEEFPSSIPKPESESRHLYTGHRMDHKQAPSMLILGKVSAPSFDVVSRFRCVIGGSLLFVSLTHT